MIYNVVVNDNFMIKHIYNLFVQVGIIFNQSIDTIIKNYINQGNLSIDVVNENLYTQYVKYIASGDIDKLLFEFNNQLINSLYEM